MFRYKFPEADLKSAVKYLKTKKGRLQQKPWVLKYESDLKVKDGKIRYKDKEIIASENIDDYLRRRVCSKAADINTSRDSAFYQLSKEVVGVSRRAIMEFFRKQKQLMFYVSHHNQKMLEMLNLVQWPWIVHEN